MTSNLTHAKTFWTRIFGRRKVGACPPSNEDVIPHLLSRTSGAHTSCSLYLTTVDGIAGCKTCPHLSDYLTVPCQEHSYGTRVARMPSQSQNSGLTTYGYPSTCVWSRCQVCFSPDDLGVYNFPRQPGHLVIILGSAISLGKLFRRDLEAMEEVF